MATGMDTLPVATGMAIGAAYVVGAAYDMGAAYDTGATTDVVIGAPTGAAYDMVIGAATGRCCTTEGPISAGSGAPHSMTSCTTAGIVWRTVPAWIVSYLVCPGAEVS